METFIAIIHIITALALIALVLLQDSKGGGMGGAFGGGGSNSILGATGGATLAQKVTRIAAVIFALTSILLATFANKRSSVVDNLKNLPAAPVETAAPAVSGDAAAAATTPAPAAETTTTTQAPKK
ncbi:MAG: preprotein translocase subunit SecG [Pseudobdellovibrionaceae bacterium]